MRRVTQPPASPPRASAFVKVAILLARVLAVAPGSRAQSPDLSEDRSLPAGTVKALDDIIQDAIDRQHLPSVAVGIWIPGRGNYVAARGEANLLTHSARTLNQPFRIASKPKTFVGTVILQLVNWGLLNFVLLQRIAERVTGRPSRPLLRCPAPFTVTPSTPPRRFFSIARYPIRTTQAAPAA